jgi:hypothetical protein
MALGWAAGKERLHRVWASREQEVVIRYSIALMKLQRRATAQGRNESVPRGLKSVRENLPVVKRVPQGRLNLAQDAVLGRNSRDEKSRRDDWKFFARIQDHVSINLFSRPCGTSQRLRPNPGLRPGLSSAVPAGLDSLAPGGAYPARNTSSRKEPRANGPPMLLPLATRRPKLSPAAATAILVVREFVACTCLVL